MSKWTRRVETREELILTLNALDYLGKAYTIRKTLEENEEESVDTKKRVWIIEEE